MATELKVSRSSLQRITKRDLGLFSFKKRKVHYLSKVMKEKRLKRSKGLIDRFAVQEEAYNQQNDIILSPTASTIPEEYRYAKRPPKICSVMVWAGISSLGRTPIVFITTGVKINAQIYQKLVLNPIVKDLSKSMFNNKPFLFQQDGALLIQQIPLKAGFTQKFLTLFPNRNSPHLVRTLTV
ncbi:Transposase [Oopsacas minuta]|uniref:Transposase n=1 Tax=Oopsacas minuta TaxID=111878 RepID=A0AAV7K9W1_9METZ|nr:Transposase [Oopsacas minuta]